MYLGVHFLAACLTFIVPGISSALLIHRLLHRESPGLSLVLGLGAGPAALSAALGGLYYFKSGWPDWLYVSVVLPVPIVCLALMRKEFKELLKSANEIRNSISRRTIVLWLFLLLVLLHQFVQGVGFPISTHDSCTYAFYGRLIYQEKSLANYPLNEPHPDTGAVLKISHPPGLPLLYAWIYSVTGNHSSDLLVKFVSPAYSFYLLLLVGAFSSRFQGTYSGLLAAFFLAFTPLFIRQGYDNGVDPIRLFLFTAAVLTFARVIVGVCKGSDLLVPLFFAGISIYFHKGNLLVLPVCTCMCVWASRFSWRWKALIVVVGVSVVVLAGFSGTKKEISQTPGESLKRILSLHSTPPARTSRMAALGEKWTADVESGKVGGYKIFVFERLQILSRPEIFGVLYWLVIFSAVLVIIGTDRLKCETIILVAIVVSIPPILYNYYLNFRYVSLINPLAACFAASRLGMLFDRHGDRKLLGWELFKWLNAGTAAFPLFLVAFISVCPLARIFTKVHRLPECITQAFTSPDTQRQLIPRLKTIDFINSEVPLESKVLVLRAPEFYYYSKRYGFYFFDDPRIRIIDKYKKPVEGARYLKSLGINYILLDRYGRRHPAFLRTVLPEILSMRSLSELVYHGESAVYLLK